MSYMFNRYGAGGRDGMMTLFEYDWNQVSIVKAPPVYDPVSNKVQQWKRRGRYKLPAKTLPTILKEKGDTFVDVLKLDVEGSEYVFLQDTFDSLGCPPAKQIIL